MTTKFRSRMRDEPRETEFSNPYTALLCAQATVTHSGLTADDYADMIGCLAKMVFRDQPPTAAMRAAAQEWADGWARRLAACLVDVGLSPRAAKLSGTPVVVATADQMMRAAAIARGEIAPQLPRDPVARAMLAAHRKATDESEG